LSLNGIWGVLSRGGSSIILTPSEVTMHTWDVILIGGEGGFLWYEPVHDGVWKILGLTSKTSEGLALAQISGRTLSMCLE